MLGSHNSMTYLPLTGWSRILRPWVRCQSLTLMEQYNAGVRYFDIRIRLVNGKWRFCHNNAKVCDDTKVCGNAKVYGDAEVFGNAEVTTIDDYIVFKNWWSSGRYFTWTRSNNMWRVGCFYGTGEELVAKAYKDTS